MPSQAAGPVEIASVDPLANMLRQVSVETNDTKNRSRWSEPPDWWKLDVRKLNNLKANARIQAARPAPCLEDLERQIVAVTMGQSAITARAEPVSHKDSHSLQKPRRHTPETLPRGTPRRHTPETLPGDTPRRHAPETHHGGTPLRHTPETHSRDTLQRNFPETRLRLSQRPARQIIDFWASEALSQAPCICVACCACVRACAFAMQCAQATNNIIMQTPNEFIHFIT